MNKEKLNEENGRDKIDTCWIDWFQKTKETNSFSLAIFLIVLSDFVEKHPHDAHYLTVETLYSILLEEINKI